MVEPNGKALREGARFDKRAQTLIHLHIPKTAGITLQHVLYRQYRAAEIHPFFEPPAYPKVCALPPEVKAKYRLFQGHMPFGLHRALPRPSAYLTQLREPLEVSISVFYFFELNYRRTVLKQPAQEVELTLAELQNSHMQRMLDNLQTRFLAGLPNVPAGECSRELLETAKANLDAACVVGLVERFDESMLCFAKIFGWRAPYYVKTNVSRTRPARDRVAPDALEWLILRNQFDLELYQYAKTLFDAQVKEFGVSFDAMLAQYRSRNRAWGAYLNKVSRAKRKATKVKFIGEFV